MKVIPLKCEGHTLGVSITLGFGMSPVAEISHRFQCDIHTSKFTVCRLTFFGRNLHVWDVYCAFWKIMNNE